VGVAIKLALALALWASDEGKLAPKPLFRDPVYDGAADPTLIWNRTKQEWWMFYTNRRATLATDDPKDVSWVHGTRIGFAVSRDQGASWTYQGTAHIPYGTELYTHWAPDIVYESGQYHMFLTVVPGTFSDWNAAREIVHFASGDLASWRFVSKLALGSDRVIDPSLFRLSDGTWRLWYKDERDHSHIHYADSKNLNDWEAKGAAITDRSSEGPKIFRWHGQIWMIVDMWKGLAVYRSEDALHWVEQSERLLDTPGNTATDRSVGHHCDVVVNGDRAFLFYFTHQEHADEVAALPHSAQRTVLQVAELGFTNGKLTANRNAPVHVLLGRPE
jgi:hypothetical protein